MKFQAIVFALFASPASAQVTLSPAPSLKPSAAPSDEPSLKPSAAPSLKPSAAPSDEPSLKPSAAPSDEPSLKPSAAPSLKPSASPSDEPSLTPSASPSLKPSGQPSDVPSLKPSASPSDAPSLEPSASPSMLPSISAMPSTSPSASPTKPYPQIEVEFDGLCMNLVNATGMPAGTVSAYADFYTKFGDSIEENIIALMTPKLDKPGQRVLKVSITDVDGKAIPQNRRLAASEYDDLTEVKYDVTFEQFCERANCDDATSLTAEVSDFLTTTIDKDITTGTFSDDVKAIMATKGIDSTLDFVKMSTGDCTPKIAVKSILPMLWYPDWTGANEGCIMDGKEDEYMRLNPEGYYMFELLEDCCAKHYSWNYDQCAGLPVAPIGPDGAALYYPDWEGENKSCKNDGNQPTYMSNNKDAWMFEDLKTCCEARYSYNLKDCMGSAAMPAASIKWVVDHTEFKCEQRIPESWETGFDTANACCKDKLNWKNQDLCLSESTGTALPAAAGSGKYYVDWEKSTCVVDGPGSLAESWETDLYTDKASCCKARLSWKEDCLTIN